MKNFWLLIGLISTGLCVGIYQDILCGESSTTAASGGTTPQLRLIDKLATVKYSSKMGKDSLHQYIFPAGQEFTDLPLEMIELVLDKKLDALLADLPENLIIKNTLNVSQVSSVA